MVGAYYNDYKELGMELGTLIKFPYKVGMQAPSYLTGRNGETCTAFKKCVLDILGEEKIPAVSDTSISFFLKLVQFRELYYNDTK